MRVLFKLFLAVLVLAAGIGTWAGLEGHRRFVGLGPLNEQIALVVPKGSGLDAVARKLEAAGVIYDRYTFMIGARLRGVVLKAGEYEFPAGISAENAVRMMSEGRTLKHKLTIPEGLTVRQIAALVEQADFLAGEVGDLPPEGSLLPETWVLSRDDSRAELMARMQRGMEQTLAELWDKRAADLPIKSPQEALILASVVERETGLASERPKVAGVFMNRLRKGMRLQSDPTVIYGLSDGLGVMNRSLTRKDLEIENGWNTYVVDRLPKTPIANPGRAGLEAVLHPAQTDALFFVADGTGGHRFAKSLDEHNRNVNNWRKVVKERKAN